MEAVSLPVVGVRLSTSQPPPYTVEDVAALTGWDEETLLAASFPDDEEHHLLKQKRQRSDNFSLTQRKPRDQRKSPDVLNLEGQCSKKEVLEENKKEKNDMDVNSKKVEKSNGSSSVNALIPCIDQLREELSCAICLEMCFEPTTTSCGHSFCKNCLRSAADKCGNRCAKCRQLISNGRSCTINTGLWNTIQLLFPQEIEARKALARGSNILESGDIHSPPPKSRNQFSIEAFYSPQRDQLSMERRQRTSNHLIAPRQRRFSPASVVILNNKEAGGSSSSSSSVGLRRMRSVAMASEGNGIKSY